MENYVGQNKKFDLKVRLLSDSLDSIHDARKKYIARDKKQYTGSYYY